VLLLSINIAMAVPLGQGAAVVGKLHNKTQTKFLEKSQLFLIFVIKNSMLA
jgi:hypothetical protein